MGPSSVLSLCFLLIETVSELSDTCEAEGDVSTRSLSASVRAVIILVGNKTDLAELREVSEEEGQEYASQCAPSCPG